MSNLFSDVLYKKCMPYKLFGDECVNVDVQRVDELNDEQNHRVLEERKKEACYYWFYWSCIAPGGS